MPKSKKKANLCDFCGGRLEEKVIIYDKRWGQRLYTFEEIPALVCAQCGEKYLDGKVAERIESIIKSEKQPHRFKEVPVFEFSKVRD
jgi:YgiT-type zinc finger domain-containing protein